MKKKLLSLVMAVAMTSVLFAGCTAGEGTNDSGSNTNSTQEADAGVPVYKVGIVQYVNDASLDQITANLEVELDVLGEQMGVKFDYAPYYENGQADATMINQIVTNLLADQVDVLVPIATPTALICQSATEGTDIPVIFSAVSDPVGAGLVASLDAPGSNITGTSDSLNTKAVMDLILAANPDTKKVGLLYDSSQDASKAPIEDAKAYLAAKGIEVVEKTGTTNAEVMAAADSIVAAGCDAVFTPTDNTIMTAELSIYGKFIDAGIPHYCGADSFALNGAFCGYGVDYAYLGKVTADMVADVLVNGKKPAEYPVVIMDNGAATVNTDTASAIGLDYSMFAGMCTDLIETTTKEGFDK